MVSEGTNDRDFTVGTSNVSAVVNENALNVKTLERRFNERIDKEMCNIVDTVEDRIQNAILTAIDNIVAPKIELAIRSINASSGRDVTSVSANSERREHGGINPPFVSASEDNNLLSVTNINDEPRYNTQDAVSELSATGIHFDRQSHTHHMASGASNEIHHMVTMVTGAKGRHNMLTGSPQEILNSHHMVTGAKEQIHNQPQCSNQYPQTH